MRIANSLLGLGVVCLAAGSAICLAPSRAAADDGSVTVAPAINRLNASGESAAKIRQVCRRCYSGSYGYSYSSYGWDGYFGSGYASPYYYGGYNYAQPYYSGYAYSAPYYGGYGYAGPSYGSYGYATPTYGGSSYIAPPGYGYVANAHNGYGYAGPGYYSYRYGWGYPSAGWGNSYAPMYGYTPMYGSFYGGYPSYGYPSALALGTYGGYNNLYGW